MFSRKIKTVATVIAAFTTTIADLDEIIQRNIARKVSLDEGRVVLDEAIKSTNLEIRQATGIADRLQNLIGEDVPR
jgi:hypothetical protein